MVMLHRKRLSFLSLLLVFSLLLAACQPIRPASDTALPAAVEAVTADAGQDAFAGRWTGSIAVAGIELPIEVNFAAEADGYTATMDIPQQGATGIPVHSIEAALPSITFSILEGAQQATFDGLLADDGTISGEFLQAGQEGSFALTREEVTGKPGAEAEGAGIAETYTDPAGFFSVPVPTNWTIEEHAGYLQLTDPEGDMKAYLLAIPLDDLETAIATGWKTVHPDFSAEIKEIYTPPPGEGVEKSSFIDYQADDEHFIQGLAQLLNGVSYVELYEGSMVGAERRGAQLQIVSSGFKILAQEKVDLNSKEPGELTDALLAEWESFIQHAMAALEVPGAVFGIVRGGELVYAQGFGYADPATQTPMTPQTHMMIGSTGKSLTTMMMATLVDDGVMTWDTPARELYPSFAVKDPALSETLTMRNLVCACTGVPRRDLELLFNADELEPTDIINSLADFEFFTDFGEAFQYSNQMVATAGFIAGAVAEPAMADLEAAYAAALAERVTGPMGMVDTTLSLEEVLARGNYAIPHGYRIDATYVPIDFKIEQMLRPINPSGGHWSTLEDMARYMITQLNRGVAPDGTRVVSEENLLVTRQPQVKISAQSSYGLGWMVGTYKGLPMVEHGGNTLGFTSDFGFMPTIDLGLIMLANAQGANTLGTDARVRLLELLYGLESEVLPSFDFVEEQIAKSRQELAEQLAGPLDTGAVEQFAGDYSNDSLGDMALSLQEGKLLAAFGEFTTELRPKIDEEGQPDGYLMGDPPLAGFVVKLEVAADGTHQVILGEGLTEYIFLK